jgi:hypothetical protein
MKYVAPKGITNHPAVLECLSGPASGVEDYKHDVFLREGWVFRYGRNEGCRGLHCNSVDEFNHAEPIALDDYKVHLIKSGRITAGPDEHRAEFVMNFYDRHLLNGTMSQEEYDIAVKELNEICNALYLKLRKHQ